MTDSRSAILRALREARPPPAPLPELTDVGVRFERPAERFAQSVAEVGGRCVFVPDASALEGALQAIPEYAAARKVVSYVHGVAKVNVHLARVSDPHDLEDVDFCVIPGVLGVAENGAVWTPQAGAPHRAAWFLAQHVALVVPAGAIVNDMHEAYEKLQPLGHGFGTFISGPSKTADIEQSLVMGAQGPRSCTVIVVG
jgi:L-lactate dehydrogenase complex protein LldG